MRKRDHRANRELIGLIVTTASQYLCLPRSLLNEDLLSMDPVPGSIILLKVRLFIVIDQTDRQ